MRWRLREEFREWFHFHFASSNKIDFLVCWCRSEKSVDSPSQCQSAHGLFYADGPPLPLFLYSGMQKLRWWRLHVCSPWHVRLFYAGTTLGQHDLGYRFQPELLCCTRYDATTCLRHCSATTTVPALIHHFLLPCYVYPYVFYNSELFPEHVMYLDPFLKTWRHIASELIFTVYLAVPWSTSGNMPQNRGTSFCQTVCTKRHDDHSAFRENVLYGLWTWQYNLRRPDYASDTDL